MFKLRTIASLVGLLSLVALVARADTFTYTYQAAGYSVWYDSSCPPQCTLTGYMTFSSRFEPGSTISLLSPDLLDFSFSDGLDTFTIANSSFSDSLHQGIGTPELLTGPDGSIVGWGFAVTNTAGLEWSSEGYQAVNIYGPGFGGNDKITINTPYGLNTQACSSAPGLWSGPTVNPSPIPEPSALVLTFSGAFLLLWRLRPPQS